MINIDYFSKRVSTWWPKEFFYEPSLVNQADVTGKQVVQRHMLKLPASSHRSPTLLKPLKPVARVFKTSNPWLERLGARSASGKFFFFFCFQPEEKNTKLTEYYNEDVKTHPCCMCSLYFFPHCLFICIPWCDFRVHHEVISGLH